MNNKGKESKGFPHQDQTVKTTDVNFNGRFSSQTKDDDSVLWCLTHCFK